MFHEYDFLWKEVIIPSVIERYKQEALSELTKNGFVKIGKKVIVDRSELVSFFSPIRIENELDKFLSFSCVSYLEGRLTHHLIQHVNQQVIAANSSYRSIRQNVTKNILSNKGSHYKFGKDIVDSMAAKQDPEPITFQLTWKYRNWLAHGQRGPLMQRPYSVVEQDCQQFEAFVKRIFP